MDKKEYFLKYMSNLTDLLVSQCTQKGFLNGHLLVAEELEDKWNEMAPEYMVHAVPEIQAYPTVAIAWAGYIGMGMAKLWDTDWDKYKDRTDLYQDFAGPRGFDALDEHVAEDMLGLKLDSPEYKAIEDLMRSCAQTVLTMIRREDIEPQSADAFHIFAYSVKVMFLLGVSIELKQLGYKYEKMNVNMPANGTTSPEC
ncbi:MAG: hypothetical protein RR346_11710 [Bacteroidales bacterium]